MIGWQGLWKFEGAQCWSNGCLDWNLTYGYKVSDCEKITTSKVHIYISKNKRQSILDMDPSFYEKFM